MEQIKQYFANFSQEQLNLLSQFELLIKEWNEKINLISRKDIDNLTEHHILHSLAIGKVIKFVPGTRIIDVGTGGGFPGIPLAIMFPEVQFHLIDSIGKKILVVNHIVETLSLPNVTATQSRAENVKEKFDFVVSRAVTDIPTFIKFTRHLISSNDKNALPNGILYLKGGNLQSELHSVKAVIDQFDIYSFFNRPYFKQKKVVYITF